MRSALEHFKRCVALSEGIGCAGPNHCMNGHCLWYQNQLLAAIAEAQAARDDAVRAGVVQVQLFAQFSLTRFRTETGRHDEANVACAQALLLARRVGSLHCESLACSIALPSCPPLAVGECQVALDHADALERTFQLEPLPWVALVVARARAIVAAALSEPDATARLQQLRMTAAAAVGWALQGIDAALGQA